MLYYRQHFPKFPKYFYNKMTSTNNICNYYSRYGSKKHMEGSERKMRFEEHRSVDHVNMTQIYTDGSKGYKGRNNCGYSIVIMKCDDNGEPMKNYRRVTKKLHSNETLVHYKAGKAALRTVVYRRLSKDHGSGDAEIIAVTRAISYVIEKKIKDVVIYTDYTGILKKLQNECDSGSKLLNNLRNKYLESKKFNCNISLCYVPAHIGVLGNELADEYAKIGSKR